MRARDVVGGDGVIDGGGSDNWMVTDCEGKGWDGMLIEGESEQ